MFERIAKKIESTLILDLFPTHFRILSLEQDLGPFRVVNGKLHKVWRPSLFLNNTKTMFYVSGDMSEKIVENNWVDVHPCFQFNARHVTVFEAMCWSIGGGKQGSVQSLVAKSLPERWKSLFYVTSGVSKHTEERIEFGAHSFLVPPYH